MKGRWKYLLPSMAVMLVMGVLYAWSILKAPFVQEFSWTAGRKLYTDPQCFFDWRLCRRAADPPHG